MIKFHLQSCSSTNSVIKDYIEIYPKRIIVLTSNQQQSGRGQYGRSWCSNTGGLYYSIAIPVSPLICLNKNQIGFLIAKVVKNTLVNFCNNEFNIEWPNDLILNDKKLAGILCEMTKINQITYLIIGIGINVNQKSFPSYLCFYATSLFLETNQTYSVSDLSNSLTSEIIAYFHKKSIL